ncbi:MAG: sigma 54-interacting transcriptional regulator [Chthoniobacterales bacterium]
MPARLKKSEAESPRSSADSDGFATRLIEGSPDCLKVLDLDGRLLSMNESGMRTLEICDLAPFVGQEWVLFWEGEDRRACEAALAAARGGGVGRFTGFFQTAQTRRTMWFDVIVSAIPGPDGRPEKLLAASRDVTGLKRSEDLLRAMTEGTAAVTGEEFFRSLARQAARALQARYAFVSETLNPDESRSLAFWEGAGFGEGFTYRFPGTPCARVAAGYVCSTETGIQALYPEDLWLGQIGADSYVGVPMVDADGRVLGHLAVLDTKPMRPSEDDIAVLKIFATRARVELERMRAFEKLLRENQESEERFRDLFDEAPIAYVNEELDSHFLRANRTAMKILGIKPEDVPTTYGKTFAPDTPDAQRRMREAFEAIGRGADTSGVVLEMRRKDNGKPFWIQWWSRPDPSGTFTRTMFLDITERVLMERDRARLEAQNIYLQEEIRSQHNFVEIVGNSRALLGVLRQVDQVAPADSTVLIFGETGTGKELIARAIHDRSARRERPLVKVNCGAISAGLVESELFGHVKGAFTGALTNRDGRFALADGGTIFLDEVGELSPETQVKLLRVLQEQEFEPLGSSKTVRVDVRVIAATNRDLPAWVREGKFRSDLFYRLNVVPITMPPLRERADDIPLLTMFFLEKFARKFGRPIRQVAEETMARLCGYPWPGNIRELQNVIERALVLATGPVLQVDESVLPEVTSAPPEASRPDSENTSLENVERDHIIAVLTQARWQIEGEHGAAEKLHLQPSTLRSRMRKLGIARPQD